ncbi:unnamed protein product (macronuclear) [Paramecium tetraurelia]|uniref:Uncharacterized protein n=1 Tax=Paramecium tetraurelia TaxID=5888 RepID=A0DPV4_PARTE|nr:uncharacterized protein GSPATT00002470001 [Paramecium tetraurelia]CAK85071.1 unnamed protein product [Paramecium tetraurelia]|eukprot:XP_001452468.1 hypothetical protein (macronuclear) [Paramecium tetraurelia strain d4-2]
MRSSRVQINKEPKEKDFIKVAQQLTYIPIMLPSISQESLLSSARNTSNQSSKPLTRRRMNNHSQSRLSLHTKKSDLTPLTIRSHSPVSQFQQQYFDAIKNDDCEQAMAILINMMILTVDQDNLCQLIKTFRVASLTLLHFREYGKSIIYAKNTIFLSEFARDFETIQWALLHLGIICKQLQKYEIGKIFIKKSIEFTWFMQNQDEELRCYEELGKLCYFNRELELAKQLHDMSMVGNQRSDSILTISKKGIQQLINNYPPQQISIDQNILSKIVDFPFVIRATKEDRDTQNRYLRQQKLECVYIDRMYPQSVEEILNKVLQNHNFFFEIPIPIDSSYKVVKPKSRKDRIKSTQMITWIKLAIEKQKNPEYKFQPKPPVEKVEKRKLTLDQAVTERVKDKIRSSMEIIQEIKCMKPKNGDVIRLTHEKDHKRIHEHSKKELLKYAESSFLNKNVKVSFSLLIQ